MSSRMCRLGCCKFWGSFIYGTFMYLPPKTLQGAPTSRGGVSMGKGEGRELFGGDGLEEWQFHLIVPGLSAFLLVLYWDG